MANSHDSGGSREAKRKAKEELEKWSGNMSVNDMLLLYCGDPAGYFGNPERNPESKLYKQHAIEELKKCSDSIQ